jgi:hypothetical protein
MEFVCGSIFIRKMGPFEPGELVRGHKHYFDHTSIFFTGRWRARKWAAQDDYHLIEELEFEAPYHLLIEAQCRHEFEFLGGAERGLAWCVYSHRTPQGEVTTEFDGWVHAYMAEEVDLDEEKRELSIGRISRD